MALSSPGLRLTVLLVGLALGCAESPRPAAHGAPPLFADSVGQCGILDTALHAVPESTAVRCAVWFITRNGYAGVSPDDSIPLRGESFSPPGPRHALLAGRRHTLQPRAVLVCRLGPRGIFYVGVPYSDSPPADTGRLISMTAAFTDLSVEHVQPVPLDGSIPVGGVCGRTAAGGEG